MFATFDSVDKNELCQMLSVVKGDYDFEIDVYFAITHHVNLTLVFENGINVCIAFYSIKKAIEFLRSWQPAQNHMVNVYKYDITQKVYKHILNDSFNVAMAEQAVRY